MNHRAVKFEITIITFGRAADVLLNDLLCRSPVTILRYFSRKRSGRYAGEIVLLTLLCRTVSLSHTHKHTHMSELRSRRQTFRNGVRVNGVTVVGKRRFRFSATTPNVFHYYYYYPDEEGELYRFPRRFFRARPTNTKNNVF